VPPGLWLCAFIAETAHEDRRSGGVTAPTWAGWLLLALAVGCMVAGTGVLAVSVFSG
jgi:hypothetical protein